MPPDPPREQGPPGLATPSQINATPTSKTVENPVIPEKIHTPMMEGMFFSPPFHLELRNCMSPPPSPQDFQVQRPPTHPDFHEVVRYCNFNLHDVQDSFRNLDDLAFIK